MIVSYKTMPGQPITDKEIEEINAAKKMAPQFDEDCPELSESMLKSLEAAVRNRNRAAEIRRA